MSAGADGLPGYLVQSLPVTVHDNLTPEIVQNMTTKDVRAEMQARGMVISHNGKCALKDMKERLCTYLSDPLAHQHLLHTGKRLTAEVQKLHVNNAHQLQQITEELAYQAEEEGSTNRGGHRGQPPRQASTYRRGGQRGSEGERGRARPMASEDERGGSKADGECGRARGSEAEGELDGD
jgi:hypothetical protein